MMATTADYYYGTRDNSAIALHHLDQTVSSLKRLLEGPEATSDTTLSCVISLTLQGQVREEPWDVNLHLDGMQRIIELRGGLPVFDNNPALMQKVHRQVFSNRPS